MGKKREQLLTVDEVASWLRRAPHTLQNWGSLGQGPAGKRIGGRVLYRESVVEAWLEAQPDRQQ